MSNEELVSIIQSGKNRKDALGRLYVQNYGLLSSIASKYRNLDSMDDLMQEGFFGLMKAADLWSPDGGASFSHYAAFWIRSSILDYVRDNGSLIRIPAYYRERLLSYRRTVEAFKKELGRFPSPAELGTALGLSEADVERLRADARLLSPKSLQETTGGEDDDLTLEGMVVDPKDVIEDVLDKVQAEELSVLLWSLVDELEGRGPEIIRGRFQRGQTLKEIGQEIGLSTESVRQAEKKAIQSLRRKKTVGRIKPYIDWKAYSLGLHGTGLSAFRHNGMSSTERAAYKLMGISDI